MSLSIFSIPSFNSCIKGEARILEYAPSSFQRILTFLSLGQYTHISCRSGDLAFLQELGNSNQNNKFKICWNVSCRYKTVQRLFRAFYKKEKSIKTWTTRKSLAGLMLSGTSWVQQDGNGGITRLARMVFMQRALSDRAYRWRKQRNVYVNHVPEDKASSRKGEPGLALTRTVWASVRSKFSLSGAWKHAGTTDLYTKSTKWGSASTPPQSSTIFFKMVKQVFWAWIQR